MSVIKNTPNYLKKSNLPFTTILNETIELIRDPGALGIYCLLASKPPGWDIDENFLMNHFKKGRDYIRERVKYLKCLGILSTESIRDKFGKILSWETILYNHITENPTSGIKNQIPENPTSGENQIKKEAESMNHIPEKPTCGKNHLLDNPHYINKRSIQMKETTTTTTEVVVVLKISSSLRLVLKKEYELKPFTNGVIKNSADFLNYCEWAIDINRPENVSVESRVSQWVIFLRDEKFRVNPLWVNENVPDVRKPKQAFRSEYQIYVSDFNGKKFRNEISSDSIPFTYEQWLSQQQPHDKFPQN